LNVILGLEDAVWMIGANLVSAAALGYLVSVVRDLLARCKRPKARKLHWEPQAAG
jgi:hypothetical protein